MNSILYDLIIILISFFIINKLSYKDDEFEKKAVCLILTQDNIRDKISLVDQISILQKQLKIKKTLKSKITFKVIYSILIYLIGAVGLFYMSKVEIVNRADYYILILFYLIYILSFIIIIKSIYEIKFNLRLQSWIEILEKMKIKNTDFLNKKNRNHCQKQLYTIVSDSL